MMAGINDPYDQALLDYATPGHPTFQTGSTFLKRYYRNNPNIKLSSDKQVQVFLSENSGYAINREIHHGPFNPYFVYTLGHFQIDLVEVSLFVNGRDMSRDNSGVKYLLAAIDIFSRRLYLVPMRRKNTQESAEGMLKLFQKVTSQGKEIKSFFADRGTVFLATIRRITSLF